MASKPPRHGQIKVSTLKVEHAKKHLRQMTADASQVRDYHTGGVTGQSSQGAFEGASSGADYQTTSTGTVGDADSGF